MKITLTGVSKGRRGSALPAITAAFETGSATLLRAETEQRPTVLGLIASGRMKPDTGSVAIDGRDDSGDIRSRIALIDAPAVSDPAPNVSVTGVTMEELMFAGLPGTRRDASLTLAQLGMSELAKTTMNDLAPEARIGLLTELAVLRDGVEGIVLVSPDRHGGDPMVWWRIATGLAQRGYAVLAIAGDASAAAIAAHAVLARLDGDALVASTPDAEPAPEPDPAPEPPSPAPPRAEPESRPADHRPEGGAA